MIIPWLIFMAVGLITYAGFLKLAARLLRYSVSWKASFLFAGIMLVLVIFEHVLVFSQPVAIRIGIRRDAAARSHNFGWLVFQRARHKPPRCSSWVVRRDTAHGAGVCNDDCCGVRDRYSGSGFSQQSPFPAALTSSDLHTNHDCQRQKEIMNPNVDGFLRKAKKWREEFEKLRMVCLDSGLTEELKWGKPCYTYQKSNVVLIHGFKEYCALLFMKGALLKDPNGILVQQTENVQAARQIRFTNVREIVEMEPILKAYIKEAIEVEKAGLEVDYKKTSEFVIPEEFQNRLDESPALKTAFDALTPGRQRGYILYFSAAKQSKTREARVEKCLQQILDGKGLND